MMHRLVKAAAAVVGTVALVSPLAVSTFTSGVAEAAPTAPAASAPISPVGTYAVTIVNLLDGKLTIRDDGTFAFAGGPKGTWTEINKVIVMVGTLTSQDNYVFAIRQHGENLGLPTRLGTVWLNNTQWANWYGVRT
jgi:hypothetical protein